MDAKDELIEALRASVETYKALAEDRKSRIEWLEGRLDKAMALLAEAGPALPEGAKAIRSAVSGRPWRCAHPDVFVGPDGVCKMCGDAGITRPPGSES